jgi:hypothetical protein
VKQLGRELENDPRPKMKENIAKLQQKMAKMAKKAARSK